MFAMFAAVILASTQFLVHPNGISGIGTGIIDYLRSWKQTSGMALPDFLLYLLFTEFPVLLLGIWGLIRGFFSKSPLYRFLSLWWGFGLVVLVLNPSLSSVSIAYANIPLLVLAALQIVRLTELVNFPNRIVGLVQITATISLIIFSSLNFINLINFPEIDAILFRNRLIGTLLPLALLIIMTMLLAWGWNADSAKHGLLIGLGILLAVSLLGSAWKAAGLGSRPENEISRADQFVTGDSMLIQTISDLSRWNNGQANRIDVDVIGVDSPSLLWALRDFEKISAETTFPINSTPSIVITDIATELQAQTVYRGQRVVWSIRPDLNQMSIVDWIKWTFFRNAPQEKTEFVLWARNDLFKNSSTQ